MISIWILRRFWKPPPSSAAHRFQRIFVSALPPSVKLIHFSTGKSYLQKWIQHKNWIRRVKPVFPCDVSIRRNLCLKLQKVDKEDDARIRRHKAPTVSSAFSSFETSKLFYENWDIAQKNGFHYCNLVLKQNMILTPVTLNITVCVKCGSSDFLQTCLWCWPND